MNTGSIKFKKTPRQTKRKKSQEVEPLPDDEKRTSKRSRAPPEVYKSHDPEMDHILKTIKKQEEEEKKNVDAKTNGKESIKETDRRKKRKSEDTKPISKNKKTNGRKKQKTSDTEDEVDESSEEDDDYEPQEKAKVKKTPPKKPVRKSKVAPPTPSSTTKGKKSGNKDPVFFKYEKTVSINPLLLIFFIF